MSKVLLNCKSVKSMQKAKDALESLGVETFMWSDYTGGKPCVAYFSNGTATNGPIHEACAVEFTSRKEFIAAVKAQRSGESK